MSAILGLGVGAAIGTIVYTMTGTTGYGIGLGFAGLIIGLWFDAEDDE